MALNTNDILTGADGRVWWNGKLLASVTKFEAKVTGDFEKINVCGDNATYSMYNGWAGSGSMTLYKIDTEIADMMIDAYNSGVMPDLHVVTSLTNRRTKESARYQVSGVAITEFIVAAFEAKKQVEEDIPFNFSRIQRLGGIAS
ncbi:MAG: phage tail tube protein [Eubacteriales bacterium]|nr:phage tail tube protein [Eubacteriales bacterium]